MYVTIANYFTRMLETRTCVFTLTHHGLIPTAVLSLLHGLISCHSPRNLGSCRHLQPGVVLRACCSSCSGVFLFWAYGCFACLCGWCPEASRGQQRAPDSGTEGRGSESPCTLCKGSAAQNPVVSPAPPTASIAGCVDGTNSHQVWLSVPWKPSGEARDMILFEGSCGTNNPTHSRKLYPLGVAPAAA